MTERVEAIRRRAEDIINEWLDRDYAVAARPVPTKRERERLVERIVTTLTQAEREREELKRQTTYPDDPARSVAAMLSRMSPEDKQAFNFCVKAAAREAEAALGRVRALARGAADSFDRLAKMDDPVVMVALAAVAAEVLRAALEDRG